MRNTNLSIDLSRIGVTSSVSCDNGCFNPLAALDYAALNGFSLVQLYLDAQLITDQPARERIVECAQKYHLSSIIHAPGLLKVPDATDQLGVRAALHLLTCEKRPRVVYHFDETQSVEKSLAIIESLCAMGIIPCIENFHQLRGADKARQNYEKYLTLLSQIDKRSLHAIPVIDIPRVFHVALELADEDAYALTIEVLQRIGAMEFPVLFHLIDVKCRDQKRDQWCPVGQGIIPYSRIFREIAHLVRCDDIVLEFEDRENPLSSREFLQSVI